MTLEDPLPNHWPIEVSKDRTIRSHKLVVDGIGNFTVINRDTGLGRATSETSFLSLEGTLWIVSGNFDVRRIDGVTVGKAIEMIKRNASSVLDTSKLKNL